MGRPFRPQRHATRVDRADQVAEDAQRELEQRPHQPLEPVADELLPAADRVPVAAQVQPERDALLPIRQAGPPRGRRASESPTPRAHWGTKRPRGAQGARAVLGVPGPSGEGVPARPAETLRAAPGAGAVRGTRDVGHRTRKARHGRRATLEDASPAARHSGRRVQYRRRGGSCGARLQWTHCGGEWNWTNLLSIACATAENK